MRPLRSGANTVGRGTLSRSVPGRTEWVAGGGAVVAPRSLSGRVGRPGAGGGPGVAESDAGDGAADDAAGGDDTDPVRHLATRWSRLVPDADPRTAGHFAEVLHHLAALVRAEPFWPFAARALGADLVDRGLCGPPEPGGHRVERTEEGIGASLRLRREGAPA